MLLIAFVFSTASQISLCLSSLPGISFKRIRFKAIAQGTVNGNLLEDNKREKGRTSTEIRYWHTEVPNRSTNFAVRSAAVLSTVMFPDSRIPSRATSISDIESWKKKIQIKYQKLNSVALMEYT